MSKRNKGRPPIYKTPDALRAAVDRYFESCAGVPGTDADGLPVMIGEIPPTISGLSLSLGFHNRQQFTRQQDRGAAFLEVVQYARLRCEAYNEARLYDPVSFRGAAYMLQACYGWKKKEDPAALPGVRVIIQPAEDPDGSGSALTVAGAVDPERGSSAPAEDPGAGMLPAHRVRIDMMN